MDSAQIQSEIDVLKRQIADLRAQVDLLERREMVITMNGAEINKEQIEITYWRITSLLGLVQSWEKHLAQGT